MMLREMVEFHNRDFKDPQQKMQQALTLVKLLSSAVVKGPEIFPQIMRDEHQRWTSRRPEAFFHDELADIYKPLYFHQFMEQAARHDLQFLSEADYFDMIPHGFSANAVEVLDRIKGDVVLREQYMDFMRGNFRTPPRPRKATVSYYSCSLRVGLDPHGPHLRLPALIFIYAQETFESEVGGKMVSSDALARAMFWFLHENEPERFAFSQLAAAIETRARERYGFETKPAGRWGKSRSSSGRRPAPASSICI